MSAVSEGTPGGPHPDAVMAARALEAVLSHPRVSKSADERCFEALLRRALNAVPGLGAVFGLPDGLRYEFGKRTTRPDIAAIGAGGEYQGGIEVKIRSNVNDNDSGNQFDTYAAGAPAGCRLTVLVANAAAEAKFRSKLAASGATSASRWNTITLAELHGAVTEAAAGWPGIDGSAAQLLLSLMRLI